MTQWAITITIVDKPNEEKLAKQLGIGNRRRYRDRDGHLVFFKRIDSAQITKYQIEGVKVS
jgi:uncharacterized protein GlcG (DUF336 family)